MDNSVKSRLLRTFILACLILSAGIHIQAGTLQFRSGFEHKVKIGSNIVRGIDSSVKGGINNDWDRITDYLGWPERWNSYRENGGTISIVADPVNANNQVLLLQNPGNPPVPGHHGRSQIEILQNSGQVWVDDLKPNKFDKQFYRYRMYIPGDIARAVPKENRAPWYMLWESHA